MSKIISETFYGSREPQWLVESPREEQSHFDCRGCVRQFRTSGYRSKSSSMYAPARKEYLPTRSGYHLDQPSVVNADRQAYVCNAAPATHRTVERPAFDTLNTIASIPIVEFMVPLCCGKCEEKVKEELENVEGVYNVVCDQHTQRVTVSSNLDPQQLLKRVKRVKKNSQFWSGSTYLKNVHRVHRSTSRISGQNQRYMSPRSPYPDGVMETHYLKGNAVGRQAEELEFYYTGSTPSRASLDAQVYTTETPFIAAPINSSLHYGHLPSSYGPAYASEDYAMSSTGYY